MVAILFKLNCALHKRFLHVLLLVFAISFEVKSGTPLRAKNTSVSSPFRKERRWLIEELLPVNSTSAQYGFPKSGITQSLKSRNAFAAAKHNLHKHLGKRSKDTRGREFLQSITSLIKEKEDVTVQSTFSPACSPGVDLAFVMDGCGRKPFHVCIDFVKDVIRELSSSYNDTRMGVIVYSKKAKLLFGLNYFAKIQDALGALGRIRFIPKQTGMSENIGAALTKAQRMLFRGSRTVPQVLILIAGARANDDVIKPSKRLRQDGVVIYGVGFGNGYDRSQLEALSSQPVQEHVFSEDRRLSNSFTWSLRNNLCKGETNAVKEEYIQGYQGPANVIFLLDGSGNIGSKEIQSYKLFVKNVYNKVQIPPGGVEFGLIECTTRRYSQESVRTRTLQNSKLLDHTLNNLTPTNGSCELGKSLQMINTKIFTRLPEEAPKALVVVLAGKSLDDGTSAAKELSEKGARIVAFGAGSEADMKQLVSIADSPLYAFKVPLLKYLPTMSAMVVGFLNEVTEPKYVSNAISPSRAAGLSDEKAQTGYYDEFGDTESKDMDKGATNENNLIPSLRPILSELDGEDSGAWSFLVQGDETEQGHPLATQNIGPPVNPTDTEGKDWSETSNQNDLHMGETGQEGNQLQGSEIHYNTQNVSENKASNETPVNQSQYDITAAQPANSTQSGGVVNPASPTSSSSNRPNQYGANQEAVTSPSSKGNLGKGGNSGGSFGNTLGGTGQGSGTPGAVLSPNGSVSSNNGGGNSENGGTSGESSGNATPGAVTSPSGGASPGNGGGTIIATSGLSGSQTANVAPVANPGQQSGPIQVQLLPIPVLPIQTIPIQALPPVQSPQGQASNNPSNAQNQQQPGNNQSPGKTNQKATNPTETNPSKSPATTEANKGPTGKGKPKGKEAPAEANNGPTPAEANNGPKGPEVPASETETPNGNPSLPSSVSNVTPNPAGKKPAEGNNFPNAPKASKQENTNNKNLPQSSKPLPQNKSPAASNPTDTPSLASEKKPTSDSSALGGSSNVNSPNSVTNAKPTQKQQIVLCQIVCGSDCCPTSVKVMTPKPTKKTPPTTKAKKEVKQKPTAPPEVVAAPPIPVRYPQHPGWFPHPHGLPHPMPIGPIMSEPLPSSSDLPMYMTLPPATASPVINTQKEKKEPILIGQCQDYHPDCASFVMAGMCDDQSPFKDAFNVREVCMLSCGVCNRFIKHGKKVTFDVRDKGRKPEDIGFPEYSKKFLKRQVRGLQETNETP